MRFLRKWRNTVFFFLNLSLTVLMLLSFLWCFASESPALLGELLSGAGQKILVIGITYFILFYVLLKVYGGDRSVSVSVKSLRPVLAAGFLTDLSAYLQLCVLEASALSPIPLIFLFFVQLLIALIFGAICSYLAGKLCPLRPLAVLYEGQAPHISDRMLSSSGMALTALLPVSEDVPWEGLKSAETVLLSGLSPEKKMFLTRELCRRGKEVLILPDLEEILIKSSRQSFLDDALVFSCRLHGLTPEQRFVKRTFDLVFSAAGLFLLFPLMLAEGAAIYLEDKGPVLFRQKRATIHGKTFWMLKFRTMIPDAEKEGARLSSPTDERVTKVGRFLRRTRLDELPQLWNILKGEMSFVGPRPERPEFSGEYEKEYPDFPFRLYVKAGLTGLAQVTGRYDTSPKDKLTADLMYLERYSFLLDLKILLRTLLVCFSPEQAEGIKEKNKTI